MMILVSRDSMAAGDVIDSRAAKDVDDGISWLPRMSMLFIMELRISLRQDLDKDPVEVEDAYQQHSQEGSVLMTRLT